VEARAVAGRRWKAVGPAFKLRRKVNNQAVAWRNNEMTDYLRHAGRLRVEAARRPVRVI
jgi:hypothetical protein